jgi:hypothetical protein
MNPGDQRFGHFGITKSETPTRRKEPSRGQLSVQRRIGIPVRKYFSTFETTKSRGRLGAVIQQMITTIDVLKVERSFQLSAQQIRREARRVRANCQQTRESGFEGSRIP